MICRMMFALQLLYSPLKKNMKPNLFLKAYPLKFEFIFSSIFSVILTLAYLPGYVICVLFFWLCDLHGVFMRVIKHCKYSIRIMSEF